MPACGTWACCCRATCSSAEAPELRPLLHVTNGESAGATLRESALGGAVLPWGDALHEGPVPALPRPQLLEARARFLSDCGWGGREELLGSLEARDGQLLDALRDGTQVVLWFEHDLYDQLQLLDVLALAHAEGVEPELIVIGSFPGKPGFRGLGELTAAELATLWPARQRAAPAALAAAAGAWAALRAPEPTALAEWAARETTQLPFLAPALRRLLEELPSRADGLSGSERRALEAVASGARAPAAAFAAAQRLESAPFLGDTWFHRTLSALGQGDRRLLETGDGLPLPAPPPLGDAARFSGLRLCLTADGEQVLRGEADRIDLLGSERWIGGTHLTSATTWRWDARAQTISTA